MRREVFIINICDEFKFGQRRGGLAALNSSTGMAPASSARNYGRFSAAFRQGALYAALLGLLTFEPSILAAVSLSHQDALRIGQKVWQNECGRTIAGLTSWNVGENFASLGIGHFIWYPAGARGPFDESFPKYVRYVERRGAKLPDLLLGSALQPCPWNSRPKFLKAESGAKMKQLRIFLADTIDLQADFLVERLQEALPKILAAAPPAERGRIEEQFNRVASSPQGCYALIDYVNFKGEGILETERYRGRGWGLMQALAGMSGHRERAAVDEFADAAASVLRERVENSPPERHERRWLAGWLNRVATYRD
jgi:hypothetical protein